LRHPRLESGQSLVEFVLTAPLLFFLFFALIQGTALLWTCFSVQRAAMAAARHAARVEAKPKPWDSPKLQALVALAPLLALNKACLASGFLTKVETAQVEDHLVATVRFPMPIWVPLVGPWLGQHLGLPEEAPDPETKRMVQTAFQLAGKKVPNLDAVFNHLPYYRWIEFQAEAAMEPPAMSNDR
jgi:hypothetical protein